MRPVAKASRMLVGADFDEASVSAMRMAGALAVASGADITVFHSAIQHAPAYFTAAELETPEILERSSS